MKKIIGAKRKLHSEATFDESGVDSAPKPAAPGGRDLQTGPLCVDVALMHLLNPPSDLPLHVPHGLKQNVYFLVNNEANHLRRLSGKGSKFWDDCGSWSNGTSPKTLLQMNGDTVRQVTKSKDGLYCVPKTKGGVRRQVPMNPQPDSESILEMQRNYVTSKASSSYQRRVTWLNHYGFQKAPRVALYEYIGEHPGDRPHGNAKDSSSQYVRLQRRRDGQERFCHPDSASETEFRCCTCRRTFKEEKD